MAFDVWKTLYTDDFKTDRFIYHYSTFDKAIRIMQTDSLRFSPITKTNDTVEAKVRIAFLPASLISDEDYQVKTNVIYNYFRQHHPEIRLLCFSTDSEIGFAHVSDYNHLPEKARYCDVSGRGFALPRMWSQYADNNQGVCFVIDKDKFLKQVKKSVSLFECGKVEYKEYTDSFLIDEDTVEELHSQISMPANGSLMLVQMMRNREFMQYNYFQKLDDWRNEREYRIIALAGNDTPLHIQNLSACLEGIVIGENMEPAYESIIKLLVERYKMRCSVKKISFTGQICSLK